MKVSKIALSVFMVSSLFSCGQKDAGSTLPNTVQAEAPLSGIILGREWVFNIGIAYIKATDPTTIRFDLVEGHDFKFECDRNSGGFLTVYDTPPETEGTKDGVSFETPAGSIGMFNHIENAPIPNIHFSDSVLNGGFIAKIGTINIQSLTDTSVSGTIDAEGGTRTPTRIAGAFTVPLCRANASH